MLPVRSSECPFAAAAQSGRGSKDMMTQKSDGHQAQLRHRVLSAANLENFLHGLPIATWMPAQRSCGRGSPRTELCRCRLGLCATAVLQLGRALRRRLHVRKEGEVRRRHSARRARATLAIACHPFFTLAADAVGMISTRWRGVPTGRLVSVMRRPPRFFFPCSFFIRSISSFQASCCSRSDAPLRISS